MKQKQALNKSISYGTLLKFTLPTIASIIFMTIYSVVDGIFVARLISTDALSAANLTMPVVILSLAIGTMFGAGGNALAALLIGEGKEQQARGIVTSIFTIMFLTSVVFSVMGIVFLNPLLRFLGADSMLLPLCTNYATPLLIFLPFATLGMMFQTSFITEGKPQFGLLVSIMGGLTNVFLDYLFIAVFTMGVAGAAIATGIGYAVTALAGLLYFAFARQGNLYFVKPLWSVKAIWKSCSNGASEMVTSLSASVVALLLNNILMRLAGSDGVASITVTLYASGLLSSAYMGYSSGISPLIGYNYGKKDFEKLKKIYTFSLKIILSVSIATWAISQILASTLVKIFIPIGTPAFNMAVRGFRIFAFGFLFMGFNGFSSAMFTALNNGEISAILSFFRTFIFIVVAALILPLLFGLDGVWLATPFAEVLGVCMTAYYFKKMRHVYNYA